MLSITATPAAPGTTPESRAYRSGVITTFHSFAQRKPSRAVRSGSALRSDPCACASLHIDIAEMQTAGGKLNLFVAIDRASKFAFMQLVQHANRVTAPRSWNL